MPITLKTKTVFRCKCILCAHEWDADKKPFRCASCKNRRWNGEDHRYREPYQGFGDGVPVPSQIKTGDPAPRPPNNSALLETLINAKAIIEEVVEQNPCDHKKKTQCVCAEKELVTQIDTHINRLRGLKPKRSTYLVNT